MSRVDQGFLLSILSSNESFQTACDNDVKAKYLNGSYGRGWDFVCDYYNRYRKLPKLKTFRQMTGLILDEDIAQEPIKFWIDEIKNRALHENISTALESITDCLEKKDGFRALETLEKSYNEIAKTGIGTARKIESIFSLGNQVQHGYEEAKKGLTGIPTPWPTLDEVTQGWQPQDFIVWSARPGVGKTWCLLINAMIAWLNGYKVLLVSTEMSRRALARRFLSLYFRKPYKKVKQGQLDTMTEREFMSNIEQAMSQDDGKLQIVGDTFDFTLSALRSALIEGEPDILFIDGLYLIKTGANNKRHENMAEIADEVKKLAKEFDIPIQTSTQLNRKTFARGKNDVGLENVGLSDNMGWVADYVFFLLRDKDCISDKKLAIRPGKLRESEGIDDVISWWNFEGMYFAEVGREQVSPVKRPDLSDEEIARLTAGPVMDDDFNDVPFETEVNQDFDDELGF